MDLPPPSRPLLLLLLPLLLLCLHLCVAFALPQAQDPVLNKPSDEQEFSVLSLQSAGDASGSSSLELFPEKTIESDDAKLSIPLENHGGAQAKEVQGNEGAKQGVHEGLIHLPFLKVSVISLGADGEPADGRVDEESVARRVDEAVQAVEEVVRRPSIEIYDRKPFGAEHRVHERRAAKPVLARIAAALSKPWQHWNMFYSKEGIFSILSGHLKQAHNYLKNWMSSLRQKKAPTTWANTEPLAFAKPVAPVMGYTQRTVKEKMFFALQQAMLEYRSSITVQGPTSCVGKIEAGAITLRDALSSQLKQSLCGEFASTNEKEFCNFLERHPKIASLMVFSKFGINPVAVALSHSVDAGICTSSSEVSQLGASIHHVMKLGHHIRENLLSKDLLKKESPTRIKFWKSLFARNQNHCEACFHQVLDNVKKVMKRQLAHSCQTAKCPKVVSACVFAKKYKHLVRILLMLKLQPWHFAAGSCAAENSCTLLSTVVSDLEVGHKMDGRQFHRFDRAHIIERGAKWHNNNFPAAHRRACRKAMLFRSHPVGLMPVKFRSNSEHVLNQMDFLHLKPIHMENSIPENPSDDFHTMMSMVHKFHLDLLHQGPVSSKHALKILERFHDMAHRQGVKGSLIMKEISPEEFYKEFNKVLRHESSPSYQAEHEAGKQENYPSRETLLPLPQADHEVEKQENHPGIQNLSTDEASSHAQM